MIKIIFIGPRASGKTTLVESIVSSNRGIILHSNVTKGYIKSAIEFCERVAFDGYANSEYIKNLLMRNRVNHLTHIVCTFQIRPDWLTLDFVKMNSIKVFYLNPGDN